MFPSNDVPYSIVVADKLEDEKEHCQCYHNLRQH